MALVANCPPNVTGWFLAYEFLIWESTVDRTVPLGDGYFVSYFREVPKTLTGSYSLNDEDPNSRWIMTSGSFVNDYFWEGNNQTIPIYTWVASNGTTEIRLTNLGFTTFGGFWTPTSPVGYGGAPSSLLHSDRSLVDYRFYFCGDSINCCCDCPMPRSLPELIASKLRISYA